MTSLALLARRVEAAEALRVAGIEGVAADAILGETAHYRHSMRVAAAIAAAKDYVVAQRGGDAELVYECEPLAVLLADCLGVGGRGGVGGDSTDRHPGLCGLGKGRKHATDGPAWSAAIADAARAELTRLGKGGANTWSWSAYVPAGGSEAVLAIECRRPDGSIVHSCGLEVVDQAWVTTVAREGLRRSLGLPPWHPSHAIMFRGTPADWAGVVNQLAG